MIPSSTATSGDEALVAELGTALSGVFDGEVRTDSYTRHLYASDASMYAIEPLVVSYPRHADDVAAAVTVARRLDVPSWRAGRGRASPARRSPERS